MRQTNERSEKNDCLDIISKPGLMSEAQAKMKTQLKPCHAFMSLAASALCYTIVSFFKLSIFKWWQIKKKSAFLNQIRKSRKKMRYSESRRVVLLFICFTYFFLGYLFIGILMNQKDGATSKAFIIMRWWNINFGRDHVEHKVLRGVIFFLHEALLSLSVSERKSVHVETVVFISIHYPSYLDVPSWCISPSIYNSTRDLQLRFAVNSFSFFSYWTLSMTLDNAIIKTSIS